MDFRSIIRTIIAALVGLGLVVLVIVLLVKAFSGGGSPSPQVNLMQYAGTDATAQLYLSGPIVSDQEHRSMRIIVGQNQVQVVKYQGYQGTTIDQKTFANNQNAYAVFLRALALMNFTKGDSNPANADERGYCPTGSSYVYSFYANGHNLFRYWSTSCGQGTFGGDRVGVRQLFEAQVPQTVFENFIPPNLTI